MLKIQKHTLWMNERATMSLNAANLVMAWCLTKAGLDWM